MRIDAAAANSQTLSALVPVGTDLNLIVGAYGIKVADSAGKALKRNNPQGFMSFNVQATGPAPTLTLNLTGAI